MKRTTKTVLAVAAVVLGLAMRQLWEGNIADQDRLLMLRIVSAEAIWGDNRGPLEEYQRCYPDNETES